MNMPIKRSFPRKFGFCILTGILLMSVAVPLQAQRKRKQKEIVPPPEALECPYTREDIFAKINIFHDWTSAWNVACSNQNFDELRLGWEKAMKKPKGYQLRDLVPSVFIERDSDDEDDGKKKKSKRKPKKKKDVQTDVEVTAQTKAEGTFYYLSHRDFKKHYSPFAIFLRFKNLTDDMQEATKMDKAAFIKYNNAVENLEKVILKMDTLRNNNGKIEDFKVLFEKEFKPALRAVAVAYEQLLQTKRMPSEKRQALEESNQKRRAAAYIAKVKGERAKKQDQSESESEQEK